MTNAVDKVFIRMYRLGTGDCFALKLCSGNTTKQRILIDCGSWDKKFKDIESSLESLSQFFDHELDLLIVTHEHKDHVVGFQALDSFFEKALVPKEIWFGWTEQDGDDEVEKWKIEYGESKNALDKASRYFANALKKDDYRAQFSGSRLGARALEAQDQFSLSLNDFNSLYIGGMRGMEVVKKLPSRKRYLRPGQVLQQIDGMRVYVLGPPLLYESVRKEHGSEKESYRHNKTLPKTDLLLRSIGRAHKQGGPDRMLLPFDAAYASPLGPNSPYEAPNSTWRKIDYDWLQSSGNLALRMNSLTNNLSLALAFEFEESGKVMLFPGDAEFGSWESWHDIKWKGEATDNVSAEKLLNQTVFYKVAHHLSHNGTAKNLGLEMMTHPDLTAMATLDYEHISKSWKNTMPNRAILKDLLERTEGRLLISNPVGLEWDKGVPVQGKLEEYRNAMSDSRRKVFQKNVKETADYIEFVLEV